jgi:hypothetical protein
MIRLGVEVRDAASPQLRALGAELQRPEALLLPTARMGATLLRRYYRRLDNRQPNKLGGTRQHWWSKVASSVNNPILLDRSSASIAITQPGIALQVEGGTVRPRTAKALAIPIHRDSHGVWARDWKERYPHRPLFPIRGKRNMLLAEAEGDGVRPLYVLKKSQEIPADPEALPPAKDLGTPLVRYARARLATMIRRTQTAQ